jgi:MinD superfamily P-loop ATPase
MNQIAIISGKGGTGKTVLTGAFAALVKNKVIVDCDVDAADLHLLLHPCIRERHQFSAGFTAHINFDKCIRCGKCLDVCRFDAIKDIFIVDSFSCEGCAFCSLVCLADAIEMKENISGEWFISDTRFGPMFYAKLGVAEENSGKLVALVREKAREEAEAGGLEWILIDGAPGIGCPVIASLSGVDCALVVTEPTLSGLHDAERVIAVARHFGIPVKLLINKFDLNLDMTKKIESYCNDNAIQLIGKLPFDKDIVNAMIEGKTILEYSNGKIKTKIREIWGNLQSNFL